MSAPTINESQPLNSRVTPEGTVYDPDVPPQRDPDADEVEREQRNLLARVYQLMMFGLGTSALVAFWIQRHPEFQQYTSHHIGGFEVMLIFEIIAVAFISRYVENLTITMAWILFFFYAAFNGVSFAAFFLLLPPASVAFGFLITALTFGVMAAYGRYTNADLGSLRNLGMLAGIGLSLMLLVNLAFENSMAYYATSFLGIVFFCGLTSYHIHSIRELDWEFDDDNPQNDKAAVVGALLIYLDFVNLYILFLRVLGAGRGRRVR